MAIKISHSAQVACSTDSEYEAVRKWCDANGWPAGTSERGTREDNVVTKTVTVTPTGRSWVLSSGEWTPA